MTIKVVLEKMNGNTCLNVYHPTRFEKGYSTIEFFGPTVKASTVELLRKHGAKHAKKLKVEFIDKTK